MKKKYGNLRAVHDTNDGGLEVVDDRSGLRVSFIRGGTDERPTLVMETYCYDTTQRPIVEDVTRPHGHTVHVIYPITRQEEA